MPLLRISQLIFHGQFSISTRPLQHCAKRHIPVTLCSPEGHHLNTIRPDSRTHFGMMGNHSAAHAALSEKEALACAASAVNAKLVHFAEWLGSQPHVEVRRAAALLKQQSEAISSARTVSELRGYEGASAKICFPVVNSLVRHAEFHSQARIPRFKPDRWNALLDFGYTQLFAHLNVLVRGHGLNPYLGFLHSPLDQYEPLVADLQEPLRSRVDRWAVRMVNLGTALPDDFQGSPGHEGWSIVPGAFPKFLEAFAHELDRRFSSDPGSFLDLLTGQVLLIHDWVEKGAPMKFWNPQE